MESNFVRNFYCEFQGGRCRDPRCKVGHCAPENDIREDDRQIGAQRAVLSLNDRAAKITVLIDAHPQRRGTNSYSYNALFLSGAVPTVGAALDAGIPPHHLQWSVKKGYIRVS